MILENELAGITVISLEQAVAAPYCGLLLADAGARVIKVERPEGDFARGYDAGANGDSTIFAWLNRGKEAICLDLKDPADLAIIQNMLRSADVFVSNLAPGAVKRMGLTGDILRSQNPGLITCSITGYGDTDAASKKKAYDFLVQGESGVCAVTGTPVAPVRVGVSLTDLSTGLTAFSAILRALIQRRKSGQGLDLNISMFDVMADWMNMPLMAHRYMGGAPDRMGLKHTFIAPYGAFKCGDGGQVLLSVQSNREFRALSELVLQRPELPDDPKFTNNPDRFANRVELDAIVEAAFSHFDTETVIQKLDDANIANARLNSVADLSDHPFLKTSIARFADTEIEMAALPVTSNGSGTNIVPRLNEHGDRLRLEFR
jgi:formyl-CoA transferase